MTPEEFQLELSKQGIELNDKQMEQKNESHCDY